MQRSKGVSVVTDELPAGWSLPKFGELLDFRGGSQPPKSEFASTPCDGFVRLLQIRDFESDEHAVYIKDSTRWPKCEASDIMVGRYGASVGKVLSGKSGAYNVALVRMVFDQKVTHTEWAKHYLLSDYFQKPIRLLSRSAQNGFNKEEVEEFDFPLPPLPEQRHIVAKIEAGRFADMGFPLPPLREQIEIVRRTRAALEKIKHLKRHFADSESKITNLDQSNLAKAFRGELVLQDPNDEPAAQLLERIQSERADDAIAKPARGRKKRSIAKDNGRRS